MFHNSCYLSDLLLNMCRTLIVRYETPDQEKVEFELERALFHFHFVKGSRVYNKTVTIAVQ